MKLVIMVFCLILQFNVILRLILAAKLQNESKEIPLTIEKAAYNTRFYSVIAGTIIFIVFASYISASIMSKVSLLRLRIWIKNWLGTLEQWLKARARMKEAAASSHNPTRLH